MPDIKSVVPGTGPLTLPQSKSEVKKQPLDSTPVVKKSSPSLSVISQVSNTKQITQLLSKTTNPETVSHLTTLLTSIDSGVLSDSSSELSHILEGSDLGDALSTFMKGSGLLSGLSGKSKESGLESGLKLIGVDTSAFDGIAKKAGLKSIGSGITAMKSVSTFLADPSDTAKGIEAAKSTVSAFGGDGILGLFDSVKSFFENPDSDSLAGVVKSFTKLMGSDGFLDKAFTKLLDLATNKLFGKGLAEFIPGLSMLATIGESADALYTLFKYVSGDENTSLIDVLQETLEAVGVGLGATILPVGGPLIAHSMNFLLEELESQLEENQDHSDMLRNARNESSKFLEFV